jgi:Retrotransposon gag protein
MPDTMTTSQPNTEERGGVRTPEVYDGTPSKFRLFKQQVRLFLAVHPDRFSTDISKILFTLSYIRGGAAEEWAGSLAEDYIDGRATTTWAAFWTTLENRFIDKNAEERARAKLEQFTQGNRTANEYFLEFSLLTTNAGIDMKKTDQFPYLRSIINRNMNSTLIDKLYMSDSLPINMEGYVKKIESLDAIWRMREEDRKMRNTQRRGFNIARSGDWQGGWDRAPGQGPMDVDRNRTKRQPAWTPEQAQLAREGRCFLCKERGHRRPDCPKRATTSANVNTATSILNRPRLREVSVAENSEEAMTDTNEANEIAEGF